MSDPPFFISNPLPVFGHLSPDSKQQLDAYINAGNQTFREKKLLEFFRLIDWVALGERWDDRPLHKLSVPLRNQLKREIEDYRNQKALNRQENTEKREQYKLRVFEYFRIKMSTGDKLLLETLRDYELNLTGRDVNWRHYFTMDSFKKIDAFIRAPQEERQALFAKFRKDVDTYQQNYEKIHFAQTHQSSEQTFTFDDWCELMGEDMPNPGARRKSAHSTTQADMRNPVRQAYQTLKIDWGASPEAVKKQFRKLTLSHHPDLPGGSDEKMKTIINAYDAIKQYWQTSAQTAL